MPTYIVGCEICEYEKELMGVSYETAKSHVCPECEGVTVIRPVKCINKIHGYSEENGYSREEIMYDGSSPRQF